MPKLSQQEIRDRAYAFVKNWEGQTRERAESQSFWNEFFFIFGIPRRQVASFEAPVKKLGNNRGAIDLFWKGTLLIEHKSRGKNLDVAYEQAMNYFPGIETHELPQYVLVSDFFEFRLTNLDTREEHRFTLPELSEKTHLFGFISGYTKRTYRDEDPVNILVAEQVGRLHDVLLESGYDGHDLELFLVRLVYCLFADDTGIFPRDHFHYFLENKTNPNGYDTGPMLAAIFQILDRPQAKRQKNIDEDLDMFPYVNGALFSHMIPIPTFNAEMRQILLGCCSFDWSKVSPVIFGSLFQSVMDKEKRRNLGAHYTSEKNILKVVKGLLLDELLQEFEAVKHDARKLKQLHDRISKMRFFDPACGCGNFLIITYRELRLLEIEIMKELRRLSERTQHQLAIDVGLLSRLDVDAMYGIEMEEFPAKIAEVALWLTDHQMNMALSAEFGSTFIRLPLVKSANIHHGNALRLDWKNILSISTESSVNTVQPIWYVLGNPPFVGKHLRNSEQNDDMDTVCEDIPGHGVLDYVCAWYIKAAQLIQNSDIRVAFVSTNSIIQGEQVGVLWQYLQDKGVTIHFAHRTFRWSNEARGNAAVFCIIIGFGTGILPVKKLYDYSEPDAEPMEITAKEINPYLADAPTVVIENRKRPLCDVPPMIKGSQPTDNGFLLLTDEDRDNLIRLEPGAEPFIRPLISAHEFINGHRRWCLWLVDADPKTIRSLPEIKKRLECVRDFRRQSKKAATVRLADIPYLFTEIRQPQNDYILVPRHSSENRKYVPLAFFSSENIVHDSSIAVPNARIYHFGILTSAMHMAWMRQICGRIKSDYRYSNTIVYNNFPWPMNPTDVQKKRVEDAAQVVFDSRKQFPNSTLADLYDPSTMPKVLLDAHKAVDAAVEACYRKGRFKSDLERLEFLFSLYKQYVDAEKIIIQNDKTKCPVQKNKPKQAKSKSGQV